MADLIATVVIPALNSAAEIQNTLLALSTQSIRDSLHVVVVDNGSTDDTVQVAQQGADEVAIAPVRGCAVARNLGLAKTQTAFMLSLDADCVPVGPRWAEAHLTALQAAPDTTLATAGRSIPKPTSDVWAARADITPHPLFWRGHPLYAVAGNACFRAEPLRCLGGFPHLGADDAGLGIRARRAGFDFRWTPEALVHHANPQGWRGYFKQMQKVGRYGVEINGRPGSIRGFYAERVRYLPGVARHVMRGRWHEATALVLAATGQMLGAREAWRLEIPVLAELDRNAGLDAGERPLTGVR